jgi:hypothetical protein
LPGLRSCQNINMPLSEGRGISTRMGRGATTGM